MSRMGEKIESVINTEMENVGLIAAEECEEDSLFFSFSFFIVLRAIQYPLSNRDSR